MWVLSAHPPLDDADARAVALSSDWRARLTAPYAASRPFEARFAFGTSLAKPARPRAHQEPLTNA